MVRLAASSAVFALLFSHASALHVSEKSLAKSKFIAVMNDVTREHGLDRRISQEKLTKSIHTFPALIMAVGQTRLGKR